MPNMRFVRQSWEKVRKIDPSFAITGVLLFKHIFTIAPGALQMFSFRDEPDLYNNPKLIKHGQIVMKYVDKVLLNFGKPQDPNDEGSLCKLGSRHVLRGVQIPHYEVVGQALVATLSDGLGKDFTPELKQNWIQVYGLLCSGMQ